MDKSLVSHQHVFCWSHEDMSVDMVDYIVDEHHIDVDSGILKRAKTCGKLCGLLKQFINLGLCGLLFLDALERNVFLYDIVANGRNGIDVDKFDYIKRDCRACGLGFNFQFERLMETMRVMGDEICYPAKEYLSVQKLFATRPDLYRTVYTHAKVKAIELMIVDALAKANSYLNISSHINDPSEYWKVLRAIKQLDDTIVKTIETATEGELKESRDLILRICRRDLYQFCNEYAVPKDKLEHFKTITAQDIVCSQKASGVTLNEEDVAVCNVKIDLTRGRSNPLERQDYESGDKFSVSDDRISHLLPTSYQDMIVRVYSKKPKLVEAISEAFENFRLKTYGVKAQVNETPEKKKRRRMYIPFLLKRDVDLARLLCLSLRGFRPAVYGPEIVVLQFAYDTLFFIEASISQVLVVNAILLIFEAVTGLKTNMAKTSLFAVGEIDNFEDLGRVMGCEVAKLPCRHLGLPLGASYRSKTVWDPVIETVQQS
ncbi:hypothetical protein IFM89_025338 [Coptis chinensis]|uniref:Uncharacterized protein n=1 Tax=Coptis chinensis TaxID=261450 RepID=A0A835I435_9MAGN|nr:hypothetical protein IFM89_025338 [Coptis chinensis]